MPTTRLLEAWAYYPTPELAQAIYERLCRNREPTVMVCPDCGAQYDEEDDE